MAQTLWPIVYGPYTMANVSTSFQKLFSAIDIQSALLDSTYRQGIDPQFLTVALGTDVDMDKLDISILDKDGKPLNVGEPEIQQFGEKDGVPQYVLVYKGKIQKYQNQSFITFQYMTYIIHSYAYMFLNLD